MGFILACGGVADAQPAPQSAESVTPMTDAARNEAATTAPAKAEPALAGDDPVTQPETGAPRTRLQLGISLRYPITPSAQTGNELRTSTTVSCGDRGSKGGTISIVGSHTWWRPRIW